MNEPQWVQKVWPAWEKADNGVKAYFRRAENPEALCELPAFYRFIQACSSESVDLGAARKQWARVLFCLPWLKHEDGGTSLGRALAKHADISDMRLFQMMRADAPRDMEQLRRLLKQAGKGRKEGVPVDWQIAGKSLWYWGDKEKRRLLEDFVLTSAQNDGADE